MSEDNKRKMTEGLVSIIGKNLVLLMDEYGYTTQSLIQELEKEYGYVAKTSTLSKIVTCNKDASLQLILLIQCAKFFHVTLDDLLDENFNLERVKERKEKIHYPELNEFIEKNVSRGCSIIPKESEAFNSPLFLDSLAKKYHCYFYPTSSSENQKPNALLKGTITFTKKGNKYDVVFTIFTNKKNGTGNSFSKVYQGEGVYSTATNSIYCILQDNIEYCFIIFRSFYYNKGKQDCFIAQMLSSSSATKDRYPTALRAFMSKEEISEEHMEFIKPHLCVNFSEVSISVVELRKFGNEYEEYQEVIEQILTQMPRYEVCVFKENNLKAYFSNSVEQKKFVARMRSYMNAFHYTKVGDTIQESIREILKEFDYYKE